MADWKSEKIPGKPGRRAPAWRWDQYYAVLLRRGALEQVPEEYARRFGMACLEDSALQAADWLVLLYGREYAQVEQFLERLRRMGMPRAQQYIELIKIYRKIAQREEVRIRDPFIVWKGVYTEWEIRAVLKDCVNVREAYLKNVRPWWPKGKAGRPFVVRRTA